jgi:hypothetical protein
VGGDQRENERTERENWRSRRAARVDVRPECEICPILKAAVAAFSTDLTHSHTTLHYTTLPYTTRHYTTLHYTTLRYTEVKTCSFGAAEFNGGN